MDAGDAGVAGRGGGRIGLTGLLLAAVLSLALAGTAGAEAEWCDTGSPPPNDFRLQPTGGGSAGSPPAWLKSTDNGGALQATYAATGQIDVSQVGQLQGGVAHGMHTAVAAREKAGARR